MTGFARCRRALAICAAIGSVAPHAAGAGCSFRAQGEGRVAAIIDGRSFRLQDGREVRLAGVEPADNGAAVLASLLSGREVTLRGETDAPDRYGRQAAFVFVADSPRPVQGELLAQGAALIAGSIADPACAAELGAAEAVARAAGRGVWLGSAAIKSAENTDELLGRLGQFTVIEGKVRSVRQAGATYYLNFGRRWTQDFAVTISRRVLPSFEAAGIALKSLEYRRVRVRGFVERRGGPRIELLRVGQIELLGD